LEQDTEIDWYCDLGESGGIRRCIHLKKIR
jgi:hypothetical protein